MPRWVAPVRRLDRSAVAGSVVKAELGARHRKGGWHRQAIRLHLVSGDAPDRKKPHIRLVGRIGWVAPAKVGGTGKATRPVSGRWKRGQRTTQHSTNRRRHKPPFRRAEGTNRLSAGRRRHRPALSRGRFVWPVKPNPVRERKQWVLMNYQIIANATSPQTGVDCRSKLP